MEQACILGETSNYNKHISFLTYYNKFLIVLGVITDLKPQANQLLAGVNIGLASKIGFTGKEARWIRGFFLAQLIFWSGYGAYYTFTRRYIEEVRGQDYAFVSMLTGAEEAPLIAAVILGFLADRMGRRRAVLLGIGESVAVLAMGYTGIEYLPLLAGVAAFFYAIGYSAFLGAMLSGVRGSGYRYSIIAAAGSIGWGMGGVLGGLLYGLGARVAFTISAFLIGVAYIIAYIHIEAGLEVERQPRIGEVVRASRRALVLVIAIVVGQTALGLFFSAASLKLSSEIEDPVLFGIAFSTITAFLGALVRPIAGKTSDKIGHDRLLLATNIAYILLSYSVAVLYGLTLIIAWILPVFPFRDVSISLSISTRLPSHLQATAAGIISFSTSISGLMIISIAPQLKSQTIIDVFYINTILLSLSSILIAYEIYRKTKPSPSRHATL